MGSTTPAPWSIPYPTGTDRVMDGDNAMQAISERVATLLGNDLRTPGSAGYVQIGLASGWTGTTSYMIRSGWVQVLLLPVRATWPANTVIGTLPAAAKPAANAYGWAVGANTAGAQLVMAQASDGALIAVTAGTTAGGLLGQFSFPAP